MQTYCTDSRLGGNLNTGFVWSDDEKWADVVCLNYSRCVADLQNSFKGSVHLFTFHVVYHKSFFKLSPLCFPLALRRSQLCRTFDTPVCLYFTAVWTDGGWEPFGFCNVTQKGSFVSFVAVFFCCVAQTLRTKVLTRQTRHLKYEQQVVRRLKGGNFTHGEIKDGAVTERSVLPLVARRSVNESNMKWV